MDEVTNAETDDPVQFIDIIALGVMSGAYAAVAGLLLSLILSIVALFSPTEPDVPGDFDFYFCRLPAFGVFWATLAFGGLTWICFFVMFVKRQDRHGVGTPLIITIHALVFCFAMIVCALCWVYSGNALELW